MLYFITELSIWTNAFLIGFTSESPIYRTFAAHPGSFNSYSYTNETLQKALNDQSDVKACYYHSLNGPEGEDTVFGLRVLKERMVFVITFITITHLLRWMLETFLAQTPKAVKNLLRMERQWQMGGTSEELAARAEQKEAARTASFNAAATGGVLPGTEAGRTLVTGGGGAETDSGTTPRDNTVVAGGRPRRHTLSRRRRTKLFAQDEFGKLQLQPSSRNIATHAELVTPASTAHNRQPSEMDRFKSATTFDDDESSSNAEAALQMPSASSAQTSFDSYDTLTGHKHHYINERGTQRAPAQKRVPAAMMSPVSTTRVSGAVDDLVPTLPSNAGKLTVSARQVDRRTSGSNAGTSRARVGTIPRRKAPSP